MLIHLYLLFLSWGYSGIIQLRLKLYHVGIFKQSKLPCPVIGVGNITTGGTGKTPTVIEITRILRRHYKKVSILIRGYRRDSSIPNIVVRPDTDVRLVGDEPLLMMHTLVERDYAPAEENRCDASADSEISIIVGSNRHRSGQIALERFQADVIVLDDGFQHLQIARTFDLVLIDATRPFGGNHLLPAGFLREPLQHLTRASAFLITRSDEVHDTSPIITILRKIHPEAPIFQGVHAYEAVRKIGSQEKVTLDTLVSQKLLAVSGLGNPDSFHRLLKLCQLQVAQYLDFPDHHWYTNEDIERVHRIMVEQNLDAVISTEKDEAKLLPRIEHSGIACYIITIRMSIQPEEGFEAVLLESLEKQ